MSDLSALSNDELLSLYRSAPAAESGPLRITVTPKDSSPLAGMSDDQLKAAYTASRGPGYAEDMVRAVPTGLVKGTTGLLGMPGDIVGGMGNITEAALDFVGGRLGVPREWLTEAKDYVRSARKVVNRQYPTSETLRKGVEAAGDLIQENTGLPVGGPLYEPQTLPGKYTETVAEFVPGAVLGPGGMVRNAARFAVAPGIASETAGQLTKGSPVEPVARAGAAVAAGGVGAILTRPRTAEQALQRQIPEGLDPAVIDQAQGLVEEAARRGIRLTIPEAVEQVSPGAGAGMLGTMRVLETAPSTRGQMAPVFADRPAQVERAAGSEFGAMAPQTPVPATIGPAAGRAAEETLGDVRGVINKATDPFYKRAETVRLTPQEFARVKALPGYPEAAKAVRSDPQLNRYVANLPDDSIGFLNEVKKQLDQSAKNAASPLAQNPNMQRATGFGMDATAARKIGVNASSDYEIALRVQEETRRRFLEPLLQGPLGKLADKDITTRKAIEALFPKNPVPGSSEEVATAVSALSMRNPTAARQLVRAHVESTFDRAARDLQAGPNQYGAANFVKELVGNSQSRANIEAAMRALPDGDKLWSGFEKFLDIAAATGKRQRPGSLTAFNAQELRDMSQGRFASEAAKVASAPQRVLTKLGDAWDQWQLGRNLDQLAAILTDPKAGPYLKVIASRPTTSRGAQITAGKLIALGWISKDQRAKQNK